VSARRCAKFSLLVDNWRVVIGGVLLTAMTTATFYLITVHTPKFGKSVLHLSTSDSPMVTLLVAVSNFVWLPIGGTVSDRFGRKPLLLAITALAIGTAHPALPWLSAHLRHDRYVACVDGQTRNSLEDYLLRRAKAIRRQTLV
jgi:MFS family permease